MNLDLSYLREEKTISRFLEIAEFDRTVWGDPTVPDGDHIWRVWCEYAYVEVALDRDKIIGLLAAFPTNDGEHLLHKLAVDSNYREQGIGRTLFTHHNNYLDENDLTSRFTTDPTNGPMLRLSNELGYGTETFVANYYGSGKHRMVRAREPFSRYRNFG